MSRQHEVARGPAIAARLLQQRLFPTPDTSSVTAFKYTSLEQTWLNNTYRRVELGSEEFVVGNVVAVLGSNPQIYLPEGIYQFHLRCRLYQQSEEFFTGAASIDMALVLSGSRQDTTRESYWVNSDAITMDTLFAVASGQWVALSVRSWAWDEMYAECEEFSGHWVAPYHEFSA